MDFIHRHHISELIDRPDIPAADIDRNLYELEMINRWLGGHAGTLRGFKTLASDLQGLTICEIGCGAADNLHAIAKHNHSGKASHNYIGIDLNPECIRVAKAAAWEKLPQFIESDYRQVSFSQKPDILFSSLFCHHFTEEQLTDMFRWMRTRSAIGFFINDLHRHPLAYYAIRILTVLFSRSYLVKNDAPLSVLKGFKRKELKTILEEAGILHYTIRRQWAFRWLVIVRS